MFYLLKKQQKMCIIKVMCGLAYFYELRRILDEFVKLPPPFPFQDLVVVDIWLPLNTIVSFLSR